MRASEIATSSSLIRYSNARIDSFVMLSEEVSSVYINLQPENNRNSQWIGSFQDKKRPHSSAHFRIFYCLQGLRQIGRSCVNAFMQKITVSLLISDWLFVDSWHLGVNVGLCRRRYFPFSGSQIEKIHLVTV